MAPRRRPHLAAASHLPTTGNPPFPPTGRGPPRKLFRILLRKGDLPQLPLKSQVFEVAFNKIGVPLNKLEETKNGFYASSDSQTSIEKLMTDEAQIALAKINLKSTLPPEMRAKRSIFARQVDSTVGLRDAGEIKDEISKNHTWAKIDEIVKIKDYTHVFKIVAKDLKTAELIKENGLFLFNTRIAPHQLESEKYTPVLVCFKCYKFEEHTTNKCTSKKTLCSECGEEGHTYRECSSTTKKCLNCKAPNNNHRTLAASCPYRKSKILAKENKIQEKAEKRENAAYASIAKKAVEEVKIPKTNIINITNDTQLKMIAIILEAHIASLQEPGSYGRILSESMKRNYGFDAVFPDRDSAKIFNLQVRPSTSREEPEVSAPNVPRNGKRKETQQTTPRREGDEFSEPPTPKSKKPKKSSRTTPERETSNLSKVTTLGGSSLPPLTKEACRVKLFRCSSDKSITPRDPDNRYFLAQLRKTEGGLRLGAAHGEYNDIIHLIQDGTFKLDLNDIHVVEPYIFASLQKRVANRVKPSRPSQVYKHGN